MKVIVVGGGVIGLAIAWRAVGEGMAVTVVDPEPGRKASHIAAGMLSPITDLTHKAEPLLRLSMAAHERYPSYVAELEETTGMSTGHRRDGLLEVGVDDEDLAGIAALTEFRASLGIPVQTLDAAGCRDVEPGLSPAVRGGAFAPDDGSVDPRRLTAALVAAVERLGGELVRRSVAEVLVDGRARGVRLDGGDVIDGDRVVLAAGCWTHLLGGLPPGLVPQIRPIKGQVLRLRSDGPVFARTLRGSVHGKGTYVVPRADGEVAIGATREDAGYDTTVTAGGLWQLLNDARAVLPGVTGLAVGELGAGLRPGSPDDAPLLGPTEVPGLLLATGHYRIGIHLSAVTADAIVCALATGELPDVAKPFSATRFVSSRPVSQVGR